jgi:aryl sulfotransferase
MKRAAAKESRKITLRTFEAGKEYENMKKELIMPARVVRDFLSDSRVWNDFLSEGGFVKGDIVVADPFKAGTTLTQRIIQQILSNGEESSADLSDVSPWLDSSFGDHKRMLQNLKEQKLNGRQRVIKSHLPADAVPISPDVHYLFVARNGKELVLSLHNYLKHFTPETILVINKIYHAWSGKKGRLVIPEEVKDFFDRWLDTSGYGCCDIFDIVASWWKYQEHPNVLFVHYDQLVHDLQKQIERIATFIGRDPATLRMDTIKEHCSFEYMKKRAGSFIPFSGKHMDDAQQFFEKGPHRNFSEEITRQQAERFDKIALERLGRECADWLEGGLFPASSGQEHVVPARAAFRGWKFEDCDKQNVLC